MSNYKIGDEIVCIDAFGVENYLTAGNLYVCEAFSACCGTFVHVGHPPNEGRHVTCDHCGARVIDRPAFFKWRFIKVDKIGDEEQDERDAARELDESRERELAQSDLV